MAEGVSCLGYHVLPHKKSQIHQLEDQNKKVTELETVTKVTETVKLHTSNYIPNVISKMVCLKNLYCGHKGMLLWLVSGPTHEHKG